MAGSPPFRENRGLQIASRDMHASRLVHGSEPNPRKFKVPCESEALFIFERSRLF